MSNSISFQKSPKSNTRKLPFFPRFGLFIDVGGRQLSYRQVPLLEVLANVIQNKSGMKGFLESTREMLQEVRLFGFEKMEETKD
jgi:hypothetical protein